MSTENVSNNISNNISYGNRIDLNKALENAINNEKLLRKNDNRYKQTIWSKRLKEHFNDKDIQLDISKYDNL